MSVAVSSINVAVRRLRSSVSREPDARIASAPAVVDVMGGLGESAGSLMLAATLGHSVVVAACPRRDGMLEVRPPDAEGDGAHAAVSIPMPALQRAASVDGDVCLPDSVAPLTQYTEPVVAAVCALLASDFAARLSTGMTVECQLADAAAFVAGGPSALAAASLEALAAAIDPAVDRAAILACAERLTRWTVLRFAGLRAIMAGLVGQPRTLLQLRRQAPYSLNQIELPAHVALAAIEVHPARPIRLERVAEAQLASNMGHRMIQELARTDPAIAAANGCLANISPNDYVERIRDQLPSKITGKAFMSKYADFPEAAAIEPDRPYKPRSRAEHHIYENQRVHDFAACIVRARRNNDETPLVQAGELMYASHWSHSQRCGLGSVETDVITQLVRKHGPAGGLYGAKLAGGWADGLMVILLRNDKAANAALHDVAAQAAQRFKTPFRVLTGSDAGASVLGARSAEADAATSAS